MRLFIVLFLCCIVSIPVYADGGVHVPGVPISDGAMVLPPAGASVHADKLTRQEVSIMHKMGVRMAFEGEMPYIVPLEISPRQLVNTELLDFSGIQLNNLPQWVIHFKKIRKLDLSNTNISVRQTIILIGNYVGKNLEILDLSNGSIDGGATQALNGLKNLRELNLANVSPSGPNDWFKNTCIKSLLKLDMSGNDLDDDWFAPFSDLHIGCMPNIRVLNLSNTDIDLSELEADKLPVGLEVLDITKNNDYELNESFGNVFVLPNLIQLKIDDHVKIPASLKKRLSRNR